MDKLGIMNNGVKHFGCVVPVMPGVRRQANPGVRNLMNDKGQSQERGGVCTTTASTASDVYGLLASLVMHAEQLRWARVNTLVAIEAIFLAAWAGGVC